MSRQELVASYQAGELSRRAFIRRLVGAGVSFGAAASYAHLLAPGAKAATNDTNFYEIDAIRIRSQSRRQILNERKVRIRLAISGPGTVQILVRTRRDGRLLTLARRDGRQFAPGSVVVSVPLTRTGRRVLRKGGRLRLIAEAKASFPGNERETLKTTKVIA